jgi:hypothetical protein
MYASSADEDAGLLVGVYRGALVRDEDYERAIASILACDANAVKRGLVSTALMVTDASTPSPPAIWRQRMAQANNELCVERYYFAFVSPNLLIRGVFTAVMWLTRGRRGHHMVAFSDLAQASHWVQAHTGHTPVAIRRLYEQALRQASSGELAAGSARAS